MVLTAMKMILLQINVITLTLTPVKNGKRPVFSLPRTFELPESMRRGNAFSDLPLLSKFVKECVNSLRAGTNRIVLCMEDDSLISKEYQHLPCKPKNLLSFARLEAEAVLPDSIDDYLLLNYEYGRINETTGKFTSALFAAKSALVSGLKKSFSRSGLKLVKIAPPAMGLLLAVQSTVSSAGQTAAVLDLGFEKMRLLVLHDGRPVFQRSFEGIYEDILEIIMREKSVSLSDAAVLIGRNGVYAGDATALSKEAAGQISTLMDAGANELVRNIRMVLSSERLELNRIVFCGAMSSLPNFSEFWGQLGLDVPLEDIDLHAATKHLPRVSLQTSAAGLRPAAFITLSGLISSKKSKEFDFLEALKYRSGLGPGNVAALVLVTLLAVGVMSLQPAILMMKTAQAKQDLSALTDPRYTEVKALLQEQAQWNSRLSALRGDRSVLPFGKSKTQQAAAQLWGQVSAKVQSVQTYAVDNAAGSITLAFQVEKFSDYLTVKQAIESGGTFKIAAPFTITAAEKGYNCSVVLKIVGFEAWNSGSKGGAAK